MVGETEGYDIAAVVGDWGGDGHEKTEEFMFCSTLTAKEISLAYKAGVEKIGFDLIADVALDYEDNILALNFFDMLIASGFDEAMLETDLGKEDYFDLWLYFVRTGNTSFEYVKAKSQSIDIGGYGLF